MTTDTIIETVISSGIIEATTVSGIWAIYKQYLDEYIGKCLKYFIAAGTLRQYLGNFEKFVLLNNGLRTVTYYENGLARGSLEYGIHDEFFPAVRSYPTRPLEIRRFFLNNEEYSAADWLIKSKQYKLENFKSEIIKDNQ